MIIKRRRDYEGYLGYTLDWVRAYQFLGKVYRVYMLFNPEFLRFVWNDWPEKRVRVFWLYVKSLLFVIDPVAATTEKLQGEMDAFNARWRKMVESGAIERMFKNDFEPLDLDTWGDEGEVSPV